VEQVLNPQSKVSLKRVFISYKSDDEYFARGIVESLEAIGLNCWIASRDIPEGAAFNREIPTAIDVAELVVLILTRKADESEEVQREIALATQGKKKILPINIDGCKPVNLHYWLATIQWLSFGDCGSFNFLAQTISEKFFGITATYFKESAVSVNATRFIPMYLGQLDPMHEAILESLVKELDLSGIPVLQWFEDGFAVLMLREKLTYADPIELLQDRRRIHLKIINSRDRLKEALKNAPCAHPLFLERSPDIEYVMSVHQLLTPDGLRDTDLYAICEPSLVGITDDPNQTVVSAKEAYLNLANVKPTAALSQLKPISTKTSCFYVGWSNVVLADRNVNSADFQRLEGFELELQKLWFQMNAYDARLDECVLFPLKYDVVAVKREVNKAKLQLSRFKKVDSVGSTHINTLKEALFDSCRIKSLVENIDEKLAMF